MRNTIKNHNDFIRTAQDIEARSAFFFVRAKPAKLSGDARYGLVAAKKTFRFAVQRNRAKRLLRDWLRYNQDLMLADKDYVFIARHAILDAGREEGRTAMAKALEYIRKQNV